MLLQFNVSTAERMFSAIAGNHAVFVQELVLSWGGKIMPENVIEYKISLAVFRNFLKTGLLTTEEYVKAEQILAEKCGVSLCSIFREIP